MIEKLYVISSESTLPYENIALESWLLHHVEPGECLMYLWQNRHTVVIGKNQNSWNECKIQELEKDGGFLARRLSGGGAVFHDLGNLNFTFLVRKEDYCVTTQTEVILEAVRDCGIQAERTGRNDLVVAGKKFSGNAFYQTGEGCCHHGTILIEADKQNLSKYLQVSKEKLQSKGVASVKSRVTNLVEHKPELTVEQVRQSLIQAFSRVYGREAVPMDKSRIDWEEVKGFERMFSSWEWKYGRRIPFQHQMKRRFSWGDMEIQMEVNEGMIKAAACYSDGLDVWMAQELEQKLTGQRYRPEAVIEAIEQVNTQNRLQQQMKEDIRAWLHEGI